MPNLFNITAALTTLRKNHPDQLQMLLMDTVCAHNLPAMALIIDAGADLDGTNKNGHTALHLAAYVAIRYGLTDAVKLLVEKGADLDVTDKNGNTVLHLAASNDRIDVVKLLIDKGADLDVPDKDGDTALHVAALNGHTDAVKLLTSKRTPQNINSSKRPEEVTSIAAIRAALNLK
jgi:ankyrin repeat protein